MFWIACMVWQWEWLAPVLMLTAATVWLVRKERARRAQLAADADRQNRLVLEGDERGTYGEFPISDGERAA